MLKAVIKSEITQGPIAHKFGKNWKSGFFLTPEQTEFLFLILFQSIE